MAEILVPLAISSQLDITGEERIHAAHTQFVSRIPFLLITGNLVNGQVGDDDTYQYGVFSASPSFTVTVLSGSLPPGASISTGGLVTFVYTTAGSYSWVLQIKDAVGNTKTLADSATIAPMTIAGDIPDGPTGTVVDFDYTVDGGVLPLASFVLGGTLPTGLSMAVDGHISGTITTPGDYTWSVTVTDDFGNTAIVNDTCSVNALLYIDGTLDDGVVGDAYSSGLTAHDGTPPYVVWSIIEGTLPAGLSIDPDTGIISGTPT